MTQRTLQQLRQILLANAKDPIPLSSIVRNAGGIKEVKALDPTNAESTLIKSARVVQKTNAEQAPPETIDTQAISDWVDTNVGKDTVVGD